MSKPLEPVEVVDTLVRTAPPLTVTFLDLSNMYLSNTVYVFTALYTLFQIIILAPKVKETLTGKTKIKSKSKPEGGDKDVSKRRTAR